MERFSGGIHRAQGCPGSRDSRRVPKAQGEAEGFWEQMSPMGGKREGTRDCAAERVHGGSQGRTEGQSPQPGRRGAGRPPAHPAPWWRGAGLEVFPGHQATRVSPGGCNSSSAPVPLSGPAPGACYCRCRAAPPPPLACPCPLHCALSLPHASHPCKKQFGVPQPCPRPVLLGLPLLPPCMLFPHPRQFLSPHQGLVPTTPSPSRKAASMGRSPPHRATSKISGGFSHQGSPPAP